MKEGDFVEIDYLGMVKSTGDYFDVTNEEKAKEVGLYQANKKFGPVIVVVGARHVLEGLDDALLELGVGDEKSIDIPAEKAFGKRDPKLITTVPLREFSKQGIMPRAGMRLDIGGTWATVKNVSSGRVTLDFNHSLASRDLVYDIKVLRTVDDVGEKLRALIDIHFNNFDHTKNKIEIDEEGNVKLNASGLKKEISETIRDVLETESKKYIPEIASIEVTS
ncbi:MAG TPA: peptidylprolyl isomerase [Candidatus Methanofastidiosa archaeon]|nr:peptidylprolyl isomerase [Candidatus Methanofastidiosa archaeon]HPR42181.1 peptidylprolyl isomerase [Candidatus Methanofastidiosa archaeon]